MTKSLMWLLDCLLQDCSRRCGTDTHRDYLTISRRTKHEGISFLTISLPNYCQDFEEALKVRSVSPSHFLGFKKRGALPVLLRGLLERVFDPGDGRLLDIPSEEAIFLVRQVCLAFKKVRLPCTETRTKETLDGYVKCEQELSGATELIPDGMWFSFGRVSDIVWGEVLGGCANRVSAGASFPSHGPGATAEKIFGNSKYRLETWHTRLETSFPIDTHGVPTPCGANGELFNQVEFLEPGAEPPTRVITVPKTLKAPRVIAIEPVCMQYIQQGLLKIIVDDLEKHPLTAGHVNFRDQSVNRSLALASSKHGQMATMDLSEASDRVHKDVVYRMLRSVPDLRDAIFACRSQHARLPDGQVIPLSKFASMGSALCFPVEAMVFYILCITARLHIANLRPTRRNILRMSRRVYVYGDDLIVPADEVPVIADHLHAFALKVNYRKTFATGMFRESCGMDAYNGVNVTPVYVRSMPPSDKQDSSALVSFVSLSNQLYLAGMWVSASRVRDFVHDLIGFELPLVRETASCLGWVNLKQAYSFQRINKHLHRPEVKSLVLVSVERDDPLDGYHALMKFFLKVGSQPIQGKHLEKTVRPGSANIKRRWAHPC